MSLSPFLKAPSVCEEKVVITVSYVRRSGAYKCRVRVQSEIPRFTLDFIVIFRTIQMIRFKLYILALETIKSNLNSKYKLKNWDKYTHLFKYLFNCFKFLTQAEF